MKCRKVEMRENAARRISLPITFAAHHFLCADQLPRAGRFQCSDNFHFTSQRSTTSTSFEIPFDWILPGLSHTVIILP